MSRWVYALLIALPLALVAARTGWSPLAVFVLAALAVIPLAALIAQSTEEISRHLGAYLGGLLNATFGNAAELIISLAALFAGLTDVVRASIAGSVIGNSLFVLGMSMLLGGWRYRRQHFDTRVAAQYASLLALTVVGLVIPTLVGTVGGGIVAGQDVPTIGQIHALSTVVAILLLVGYIGYAAYAVFGIRAQPPTVAEEVPLPPLEVMAEEVLEAVEQPKAARKFGWMPGWLRVEGSPWGAGVALVIATVLTAVVSQVLVGAIEPVAHEVGLSTFFVGLIVLPLVGNAAEYASAVRMARRDRMDATMAITAGSAIQVSLLVAPLLVLVSDVIRKPLDFVFRPLELVIFGFVALLYALVSLDGESNWLEGLQLCIFYGIVAVAAFFVPH